MNQTAGDVETEAKKPQNQKHDENCPKHIDLLRSFERRQEIDVREKLVYIAGAGAIDFPHSRQDGFDRGVINPQNGHILCDRTSRACGASTASGFRNKSAMKASRLRSRLPNGRRTGSIDPPSLFLPWAGTVPSQG
jgi:hypothetical protein